MQRYRRRNTPAFTFLAYFTFVAVGAILTQKVTRDNAEDNEIIAEEEERRRGSMKPPAE